MKIFPRREFISVSHTAKSVSEGDAALARRRTAGREGVSSGGMGMSQSSRSARSENYPQRDPSACRWVILQFNLEFAARFARAPLHPFFFVLFSLSPRRENVAQRKVLVPCREDRAARSAECRANSSSAVKFQLQGSKEGSKGRDNLVARKRRQQASSKMVRVVRTIALALSHFKSQKFLEV